MRAWLRICAGVTGGLLWLVALFALIAWMANNEGTQWWAMFLIMVWLIISLTTLIWKVET